MPPIRKIDTAAVQAKLDAHRVAQEAARRAARAERLAAASAAEAGGERPRVDRSRALQAGSPVRHRPRARRRPQHNAAIANSVKATLTAQVLANPDDHNPLTVAKAEAGLSIAELAHKADVGTRTVSKAIELDPAVTERTYRRIARALGVSVYRISAGRYGRKSPES